MIEKADPGSVSPIATAAQDARAPGASVEASPVLSVVVVTWNSRDAMARCLEALQRHPPAGPWETIVVDNASTDGTPDLVRAMAPWARLIVNPSNRGLPAANNQGIAAAAGRYILLSNPDTEVGPGAIDALRAVLERHPRAAFAVPRLLYEDGTLQTSAGDLPTLREVLAGRQAQRRLGNDHGFWWDGWAHDEERSIGRGEAACYLVRREAIEEIGLQDESFFLDWECLDWTARARGQGWETWFSPDADVVHTGGVSIRQVPYRWIVHSHRGMYRYFARRRPGWQRPFLAVLFAGRAGVKAAAQAATRRTDADMYRRGQRSRGSRAEGR